MVSRLTANLGHPQGASSVTGRIGQHFNEIGLPDVIGAGTGDQNSARSKHLEGTEVEFLVTAERGVELALALGKGRGIQHDYAVALAGSCIVLEQVEGVSFDPLDVLLVQRGILVGDFERRPRAVNTGDMRAARSQMKGKTSLVAENIEGFAMCILRGRGIVLPLIEEGSSFLAFERVKVKLHTVHGEDRRTLLPGHQA